MSFSDKKLCQSIHKVIPSYKLISRDVSLLAIVKQTHRVKDFNPRILELVRLYWCKNRRKVKLASQDSAMEGVYGDGGRC